MRPIISWSGGKDCAWALHLLRQANVDVCGLLWVSDGRGDRYFVPPEIIEEQASILGLPLIKVMAGQLQPGRRNTVVEAYKRAAVSGADSIVYGHIKPKDLDAIKQYASDGGLEANLPFLDRNSKDLALEMISGGIKALVMASDYRALSVPLAGRKIDLRLVDFLISRGFDPCGEGGIYNSVAVGGPPFARPLDVETEVYDVPESKCLRLRLRGRPSRVV